MVKVDRRISWHYTTTILRLHIGARLTRYQNCKFHNFARTISRHVDGISRYFVPPSAGPLLPLAGAVFYCLHALADGNQCIRIREYTLEFSSTVLSTLFPYLQGVIYCYNNDTVYSVLTGVTVSRKCCVCTLLSVYCIVLRCTMNMWLPHILLIAAFFAYSSKVCISHIFPHKLAFSTAVLILFMFLLHISIRFHYLSHLVANRMAPYMCPDPCGTRWGSWFQAILYCILRHIFGVCAVCIFKKMPHKTEMPV